MREISYQPRNVRELLVELKDSAELSVDLAYSAVRYDDPELADEVRELADRADYLRYHARIALMLAAKRADEAERLVGLFQVAGSAVRITEAAADVAGVVREDGGIPAALVHAFPTAEERVFRATIDADSGYAGRRLADLELDLDTGVRLIAVRRGDGWVFGPEGDDELAAGDAIVGRGPAAGVDAVTEAATGEPIAPVDAAADVDADLERAARTVVELKDTAELAVGLAYSAARFDSDPLAREVAELERESNDRKADLERWVIEAGGAAADADELRGLLHLAAASEVICDAALDVAELVVRDVSLPPVFGAALDESEEAIASVRVAVGAEAAGSSVADVEGAGGTGVVVMAIRGADGWSFDPSPDRELAVGDAVLVRGPPVGIDRLRELAGSE